MHTTNPYGRGRKLARMLMVLQAMSQRWHTVSELAELVDSPVWTVRRDIKAFELAGIPIQSMFDVGPGVGGRYRLSVNWTEKFFKNVDLRRTK